MSDGRQTATRFVCGRVPRRCTRPHSRCADLTAGQTVRPHRPRLERIRDLSKHLSLCGNLGNTAKQLSQWSAGRGEPLTRGQAEEKKEGKKSTRLSEGEPEMEANLSSCCLDFKVYFSGEFIKKDIWKIKNIVLLWTAQLLLLQAYVLSSIVLTDVVLYYCCHSFAVSAK